MKKKVLFLINNLGGGGAERVLVNLANNLDKSKFDVTIQTVFDNGVNIQDINSDVKYVSGLKRMFRGNVLIFRMFPPSVLYRSFIKEDYDIVVGFLEGVASRIVSGCPNPKTKKVAWIHTDERNLSHIVYAFGSKKKAENAYNRMDRIICVSKTIKEGFTDVLNIKSDVEVLYNVNETGTIRRLSVESIDDEFDGDGFNIISVGRLIEVKAFDRLIRIHKKLLDSGIKNNLYIFGEGNKKEELDNLIEELSVNDTVHLMGFSRNPYKYVSKADLFVCSSRREGFSTAVTEALLVGTPVVSTEVSGAYELLGKNNEYGIVTKNDEQSLFDGIYELLSNLDKLSRYKVAASERGSTFDKKNTVIAVEKMLLNL